MTSISQSLIKSFVKVRQGEECPKKFYHQNIKRDYPDNPSDAMRLGHYFEYMATGALPRSGETPEPDTLKKGGLSLPYKRAEENAQRCMALLSDLGFKVEEVGIRIEVGEELLLSGTLDLLCRRDGRLCVVDLKYSGLIGNKWDDLGWHPETMADRFNHVCQARHYTLITEAKYSEPVDFYFVVFPPTNTEGGAIFKMELDPDGLESHIMLARSVAEEIEDQDYKAIPRFDRCLKCSLADTCTSARLIPDITIIEA